MIGNSATAADLRSNRITLGISQCKLARLSGVSRFKISAHELGDNALTADEQDRILAALKSEGDRLRKLPDEIKVDFKGTKGTTPSGDVR